MALLTTALGILDTHHDPDLGSARITRLRLECDGMRPYWLEPDTTYLLSHDGWDWIIRGGQWGQARLTQLGEPISALPLTDRAEPLQRGRSYLIQPQPGSRWELVEQG